MKPQVLWSLTDTLISFYLRFACGIRFTLQFGSRYCLFLGYLIAEKLCKLVYCTVNGSTPSWFYIYVFSTGVVKSAVWEIQRLLKRRETAQCRFLQGDRTRMHRSQHMGIMVHIIHSKYNNNNNFFYYNFNLFSAQ